jgi:hypothetical protein
MDAQDPLELDSLPSDPNEMVLRLLGMTTSSLKDIDSRITDSSSSSIRGLKIDPGKVLKDALSNTLQISQQQAAHQPINIQPSPQPVITQYVQTAPPPQEVTYDPNQLEFDFYKKIKPEDIDNQLKNINIALKKLEYKIDEVYALLSNKKKDSTLNAN